MSEIAERLENLSPERRALLQQVLRQRTAAKAAPRTIRRRDGSGPAPLSFAQQRLWFLQQMEPESAAYGLPLALRLRGRVDGAALRRSVRELARRHETLRTRFPSVAGEPLQVVDEPGAETFLVVDLAGVAGPDREREVRNLAREEGARPFDLAAGPLLRTTLVRLADADAALLLNLHHIVTDGWSAGVLTRELSALYDAFAAGREPGLPELPVQYADYAAWQRERLSGDGLDRQLDWWTRLLDGAPPLLDLPADRPRGPLRDATAAAAFVELPAAAVAALRELAHAGGATPFMAFLAAWKLLLAKLSGEEDVVVGTAVAGRTQVELEGLIGFFVNTLALRTRLGGDPTFRELLSRVRETTLGAYAHQDLPFERLVEAQNVERSLRHTPVFQVMFALESTRKGGAPELKLGPVAAEPLETAEVAAKFDLSFTLLDDGEAVAGRLMYRTDAWDAPAVERMLDLFRTMVEAVAADPDRPLSSLSPLSPEEREQVLTEWNATATEYPREETIPERFSAQAARTPDAPALAFGPVRLTYAELDHHSDALARALLEHGAGPETPVGLLLERSAGLVVSMLAALKAGASYVPLDPSHPAERLALVLSDAGVRVLLAAPELRERVPDFAGEVVEPPLPPGPPPPASEGRGENDTPGGEDRSVEIPLPQAWGRVASPGEPGGPAVLPSLARGGGAGGGGPAPDSAAYVIYTSGSTGRPKGIAVPHRAVVRLVQGTDFAQLTSADRVAQVSNPAFDAATFEVWGALLNGGILVGVDRDTALAPARFAAFLREEAVSALFLTTALFNQVVREVPGAFAPLRHVLFGGEAVDPAAVRACLEGGPPARLLHVYGPTENTTFSTWHRVESVAPGAATVPIGRGVANSTAYVLDRWMEPVPVGVPGELFVGGDGLARGYVGRAELTAEKFVPHPFSAESGARLYRTGDRVRWNARGEVEFLGRVDFQVKIRGFRIEPGEVEAALLREAGVREAVVVVREEGRGERRLVAYYAGEGAPEAQELRARLGRVLPEYMVPAALVRLEALPVNANGKLDRRALPEPESVADADAFVAPRTPTEEIVAAIWADVLGAERFGMAESFFSLGGHSLLATRVVSRLREAFGVDLPLRALFEAPTVAGLAARVDAKVRAGGGIQLPPVVPTPRDGPLPLSFAQRRLWFIDRMEPGTAIYNVPSALRLHGEVDPAALRAALDTLLARHESLRTIFAEVDGEPVQMVLAALPGVTLPEVDLSALRADSREVEARRLAGDDVLRPFDLERGPLFRATLLRLARDGFALLTNMHHIVSDGWSLGVIRRELSSLYAAALAGRAPSLPPLSVQYADYAAWQRGWLAGEVLDRQIAWWKERLAGAPPLLELPTDRPRTAVRDARGAVRGFHVPPEVGGALRALSRREGATPFMAYLAAFQALLSRWSGQDRVVVGSPIAGRNRVELEPLVGFFVNTLALPADLDGDPTFRDLLARVRETTLGAYAHQDVPFERLVEELKVERSLTHTPLFQVVLSLQNVERGEVRLGDARADGLSADRMTSRFDMVLALAEEGDDAFGWLTFRADLWDGSTVERMLGHLGALLRQAILDPALRLSDVDLLGDEERAQLLAGWNDTAAEFPDEPVHLRIAERAARTPGAPAVVAPDGTLTFAELESRANRLASLLLQRGAGPDARVGLLLERGAELLVGVLAVLKAGAGYVALDPSYPDERLAFMLDDAGAAVLVTRALLAERVPRFAGALVCVDAHAGEIAARPDAAPSAPVWPESLAYVIYTSGSTGTPKGVLVTHRGLSNYLAWFDRVVLGDEGFALPMVSRLAFDAHVRQLYPPLLRGEPAWVLSEDVAADPGAILAELADRDRVSFGGVPSLWAAALDAIEAGEHPAPRDLRAVLLGGEALPAELARRTRARFPGARIWNHYGPTEATVNTTVALVEDAERVTLGAPIANVRVYLLDGRGNPVPVGVPGELYVGGAGVSRGYLGRPDLTAERFLPDPFPGEAGARLYRTGDRVRRRADGELEYLGRVDQQVKLRGFRVELGEVEAALRGLRDVADAAVALREEVPGSPRLVGYVVPGPGAEPAPTELRRELDGRLPEYMVPAAFVVLDRLPLTANGKVDRAALPAPDPDGEHQAYVAPRSHTEEILAGIWARVLGPERIGVHENFFALGGHSLTATVAISRVRKAFGVEVPLRVLFEAPTVAGLAERVDSLMREGAGTRQPPVVRVPREPGGALPLSFAQRRLWFIEQLDPGSPLYNLPFPVRVRGRLDPAAMRRALSEVVRRHETLRTRFPAPGGDPVQVVDAPASVPLPVVDLRALPSEAAERESRRILDVEGRRGFDLVAGPLLRGRLLRLADEAWVLALNVHHIVYDGWSSGMLNAELTSLYDAYSHGRPSPLPELAFQYADYATWQRDWLSGETLERQLAWWRTHLEGAPPLLELPTDLPRPLSPANRGARVRFSIPEDATRGLHALARREGSTLFMTLLAAWQALLGRYAGQEDVVVGAPIAGRTRQEVEPLIGFFVNTLALRADLSGDPAFTELLARVRESTLGAYAHQDVPFEKLVDELGVERSLGHTPLFQVVFAVQNHERGRLRLGGLRLEPLPADTGAAAFDLNLTVVEGRDNLHPVLTYRTDLWEESTVERLLGHFRRFLEQAAAAPERPLSGISLLAPEERAQVVEEWNATATEYPREETIPERFRAQAARTPDAPALAFGPVRLTYAELDHHSDALARALLARGAGPETPVGLLLERSAGLVVSMLAVLKAGASYVPLDPSHPAERLALVLSDAGVRVLVPDPELRERVPDFAGEVVEPPLPPDPPPPASEGRGEYDGVEGEDRSVEMPLPHAWGRVASPGEPGGGAVLPSLACGGGAGGGGPAPNSVAYVIYTSGSTGRPKGIAVPHRAVVRLVQGTDFAPLTSADRVAQVSNPAFDAATFEVWGALLNGGTLVGVDRDTALAPARFAAFLREEAVSALFLTTALFNQVVREVPGAFAPLRHVLFGGEAVDPAAVRSCLQGGPPARLLHVYGPTENTTFSTWHRVEAVAPGAATVPIGRGVANSTAYVLDRWMEPVPVGVPGELFVGGDGLARGYVGRAELTAEKFVPHPYSAEPGARLYRTGDRVRWNARGEVEFLGRVDFQVKIRGFRIEPGEIEAVLLREAGVRDAVVVVREEGRGERRLVAYYAGEDAPEVQELRARLGLVLPEYMVPAALVWLEALPVTANGKVDRRALPEPESAADADAFVAPRTPTEEMVAVVWADVLRLPRVGVEDDFFALGGHSLLATQVVSRLREAFGVELPLRALFEAPTVAGLSGRVDALVRAGQGLEVPPLVRAGRSGPLPLSFAQQRLWFLDQMEPGSTAYNLPLPLRLRGTLDSGVLHGALEEIVRRHESLRTTFAAEAGDPVQWIAAPGVFSLPRVDLVRLSDADRNSELMRLAGEDALRPFDLEQGPLFRATLVRLAGDDATLLLAMHHVVSDGWSLGVLTRELSELYAASVEGRTPSLTELSVQYADYAVWQRGWLVGEVLERQLGWWRGHLVGAPPLLELPTDRPRGVGGSGRRASHRFTLSPEASAGLRALSRRESATLFMTLLAAWQLLLAKYAGEEDVVVGTPIAGRTRREMEGLIGFFVNTLAIRANLSGDPAFTELLARVREATLGAYQHQDVPFERLVEELGVERSLAHTPVFQVTFALQDTSAAVPSAPSGLELRPLEGGEGAAKFDLALTLVDREDGIGGALVYDARLFDAPTVERVATRLRILADAIVLRPEAPTSELTLLAPEERAQVVEEWNATAAEYPREETIPERFRAQAARTPDAPALAFGPVRLTYAELDHSSDALARTLLERGAGPETPVGLLLERSAGLVVSMLAVLKAGASYVPLDPSHPSERLSLVLSDAGVRVLVAAPELLERVPDFAGEVVEPPLPPGPPPPASEGRGENDGVEGEDRSVEMPLPHAWGRVASPGEPGGGAVLPSLACGGGAGGGGPSPDSVAYVIYTSGSTGRPKGIAVPHRAVVRLVQGTDFAQLTSADRVGQVSNPAFDAATFEVWGALLNGATLVGVDRDTALAPARFAAFLREEAVSALFLTTALFNQVVREVPGAFAPLRHLLFGGEAVDPAAVRSCLEGGPPARLLHVYGPTENTTFSTWHCVEAVAPGTATVPIGRGVANSTAYVLDRWMEPVPVGVPGELFVGGDGLARGYVGRAELTAERFVPHPFSAELGARLYRTGDRVRWNARGEVEFLGRVDFQVKIRGFRIEPGEIKAALLREAGVREAVVVVREEGRGERRLVGYYAGEEAPGAQELRARLGLVLPEYMVPAALVRLEALPVNANGKVDRRALPDPESAADADTLIAPRTPTEEIAAAVWADVLRLPRVGVEDDFFSLGGHSLLATQVVSRLREAFGVELPLRALFEAPTVAGLAGRVDALVRAGQGLEVPPLLRAERTGPLPLSFAQERLWVIDRIDPGSPAYNMPFTLRARGPLDVTALRAALDALVARHESLRTVVPAPDGQPVQEVRPPAGAAFRLDTLEEVTETERETCALARAADEAWRPFDLAAGPLFRATLLRVAEDDHVLVLAMHHVVSDGWSTGVLFRELGALYGAFLRGEPSPLPELPLQYADYAVWQRSWLRGEALERQVAYWRDHLAGAPPLLELPTDRPRRGARTGHGASERFHVPAETLAGLREISRAEGATLFMTTLAAFQLLLAKYAGQGDVVVGTPIAGRTRPELEDLVGFFVNTLAIRADLSGDPSFRALLGRVREATLGAYAHQDVPFEKLVEELQPERSTAHSPVFQVMFSLQNAAGEGLDFAGLSITPVAGETRTAKFDLTLTATETEDGLFGAIGYATDRFDAATVERMAGHFATLLREVVRSPNAPLPALSLLDERERLLLDAWNETALELPSGLLHERIREHARRTPDAVALLFEGRRVSYGELDSLAAGISRELRARGAGPESRIGILLDAGVEQVAAVLATQYAGAAYVPLDPSYPAERLAYVLEDAAVPLVLTRRGLENRVEGRSAGVVFVEDVEPVDFRGESAGEPHPDSLAYVIYTSGSTGRPKGVAVTRGGLAASMLSAAESVGPVRGVAASVASFAFDIWLFETLLPLAAGAAVRVVPRERVVDAGGLAEAVRDVTVLHAVPALMAELMRALPAPLPGVELAFVGGDAVPPELLDGMRAAFPRATVRVLYGPTEGTIVAASYPVPEADRPERRMVGSPLPNGRLHVCDAAGGLVPTGVPGELWIGGPRVARGYLGRPDLTAERFVPDPFGAGPGERAYRTGDRVRRLADGSLEFLGRVDAQVKIRGFRVEPGEVEAALAAHPAVGEAAVVAREHPAGGVRLVAYAVPAGAPVTGSALRDWLLGRLPEHMVPAAVQVLDALPLTPNGKVDRRALPDPDLSAETEAHVEPRTPTEEVVAAVWADVLRLPRVGASDDFFALGGHSLLATRVVSRLRAAFSVELPVRALFEAPTVAGLAGRVDALVRAGQGLEVPPLLRAERSGLLPLSFAQERLWVIDRIDPGSPAYNMPFTLRARGPLDVTALRAALDALVARHESLRTVVPAPDGQPVQEVLPAVGAAFRIDTLEEVPETEREACALARAADEAWRPFDLAAGPLFRATLLRVAEDDHVLVLAMHHVVSDGWSTGVLFRELGALYGAFLRGEPSALPELPLQYADYAVWQRSWLRGEALERQVAYWRDHLAGAPPLLELPADRPRRGAQSTRGTTHRFRLPAATAEGLREISRAEGATLFMTTLAAFQLLLAKYAGQDDVVVGTPIAGRTRPELEDLVGFFVNTLAVRADLSGDPSFRALLGRVREATLGAYAHQDVPFEKLVDELQPERSVSHSPVFQVMFSLQNAPGGAPDLPGLALVPVAPEARTSKFDLSLALGETDGGMYGSFEYAADLFDAATVARMAGHFATLLREIVEAPDARASALALTGEDERRALAAWNDMACEVPPGAVHEWIEGWVRHDPEAPAVHFGGETVTRGELDARAEAVARRLRALGAGPEVRVGIAVAPGPELVAAVLGTLKAGAAYVPLDTSYPVERLSFMLEDAGVRVIVADAVLPERIAGCGAAVLDLRAGDDAPGGGADPVRGGAGERNAAYVIYTSGSTGTPKGVVVEHRGFSATVHASRAALGFRAGEVFPALASHAFDIWGFEVLVPLASGASVRIHPREEVRDVARLADALRDADALHAVPALMQEIAAAAGRSGGGLPRMRRVFVGGDAVPPELLGEMRATFPAAEIHVLYGPTEGTVICASHAVSGQGEERRMVGRPLPGAALYVCDSSGAQVPAGVPGELWIGGARVSRGYLGRPGLTAEQYVPDPFGTEPGARLYRTGDRVRRLADGSLEFLGRVDQQVKIRGFRIEPGEVESVLARHPGVRSVVALVREDRPGDRRLVAYLQPEPGATVSPDEARDLARASLPEHMVPAALVVLEAFPRTPTGKVDRKAFPAPEVERDADDTGPRSALEREIAAAWEEVLGIEGVGVRRSFFDLGGNSLLAVRAAARLEAVLGRRVAVLDLFQHPTVASLARHLSGGDAAGDEGPEPEERAEKLSAGKGRLGRLRKRHTGRGS